MKYIKEYKNENFSEEIVLTSLKDIFIDFVDNDTFNLISTFNYTSSIVYKIRIDYPSFIAREEELSIILTNGHGYKPIDFIKHLSMKTDIINDIINCTNRFSDIYDGTVLIKEYDKSLDISGGIQIYLKINKR